MTLHLRFKVGTVTTGRISQQSGTTAAHQSCSSLLVAEPLPRMLTMSCPVTVTIAYDVSGAADAELQSVLRLWPTSGSVGGPIEYHDAAGR